jgi:outer membrane protein assembly factor BamB
MNSRNISNPSPPVQPRPTPLLLRCVVIALAAAVTLSGRPAIEARPLLLDCPLTLKWSFPSDAISSVPPLKDADSLYLPLVGGEIVSLRIRDGQLVWKTDVGGDVLLTPSGDEERLYVASEVQDAAGLSKVSAAFLRSISRSSGVVLWFNALPRKVQHTYDSRASSMFLATLGDVVIGVDKNTGAVKWSSQLPAQIATAPVFNNERLYVPLDDGELLILKAEDGMPSRRYRTRGRIAALSLATDGVIYWATSEGYVNALTEADGSLISVWRKRVGAEIQSLGQTEEGLLIVSRDNSVAYLKRQNGKRLWKRRLPDRLAAQPVVHEGYALFAPLGEDTCIVLSLRDGRQVNTLYLGANNSALASPVVVDDFLFVPTKLGLLAFAASE